MNKRRKSIGHLAHELFAGPTFDVLKRHGRKLETAGLREELATILRDVLSASDRKPFPTETLPSWWTYIRAECVFWRKNGLVEGSSRDRVWRITDEGLKMLESIREDSVKRRLIEQASAWKFTEKGRRWWKEARMGLRDEEEEIFG